MFCSQCFAIFDNSPPIDSARLGKAFTSLNSGIHHRTSLDFQVALHKTGCHICQCLLRALPLEIQEDYSQLDYYNVFSTFELFCPAGVPGKLTLSINYPGAAALARKRHNPRLRKTLDRGHTFFLHPISGPFSSELAYSGLDLSASTGSKRALGNWGKEWIRGCVTQHKNCSPSKSGSRSYPSRLIDVGCNESPAIRLCVRGEDPFEGGYATLSYCKGTSPLPGLTTLAYDEMRIHIKMELLPKTFADAVLVCRALGIKYLWVDWLCIVQDSDVDIARESSYLGDVWSNSDLTIAATKAANANEGLFAARNPFHYARWMYITYMTSASGDKSLFFIDDANYWNTRTEPSPLFQQASFIQERILSSRILHFASDLLLWECSQLTASEEFPWSIPFGRVEGTKHSVPDTLTINTTDMDPTAENSHRFYWGRVIRSYTAATVSAGEEKLLAISGVAKQVHHLIQSDYLAGLWRCSLVSDLLWQTEGLDEPHNHPKYQAPSWSWACVDGAIIPSCWITGTELIQILDVQVTPAGQDPFTKLSNGKLRISGSLVPTRMRITINNGLAETSLLDQAEPKKNAIAYDIPIKIPPGGPEHCMFMRGRSDVETELLVLPVVQCSEGQPSMVGLALDRDSWMPRGTYRRIGLFKAAYPGQPGRLLGKALANVVQDEAWFEEGQTGILTII